MRPLRSDRSRPRVSHVEANVMSARSSRSVIAAAALLVSALCAAPAFAHAPDAVKQLPPLREYFAIGVEHILGGIDHLLFLVGLILVVGRVRDVLWAVTAFTVAHSITLGLSVLGIVVPSEQYMVWVEVLIALSIAYIGFENLIWQKPRPRWPITFVFGLVHGFGFAGALSEVGVPQDQAGAALALFNVGVEAGQLMVLAVVLPIVFRLRRMEQFWRSSVRVLSAALVAMGLIWTGTRLPAGDAPATAAIESKPAQLTTKVVAGREPSPAEGGPRSVYPMTTGALVAPWVESLCAAFQELPRVRQAQCAGEAPGATLASQCTRMLNAALSSGAIKVDPLRVDGCLAATRKRFETCDFTAATALAPLAECVSLWNGTLGMGATCRSSLECRDGLHCQGVTPLQTGKCDAPQVTGGYCELSVDPLGAYVPHDPDEHRECQGMCKRGRCGADATGSALTAVQRR